MIIVLWALAATSCNFFRAPGKDKCDKIIPINKMTDLLEDVYLLEATLINPPGNYYRIVDSAQYYYGGLFEKHGVTKWEFEQALNCYLLNERDMLTIHEKLLERFSLFQTKVEQTIALQQALVEDSLSAVYDKQLRSMVRHRWHFVIPEKHHVRSDSLEMLLPER